MHESYLRWVGRYSQSGAKRRGAEVVPSAEKVRLRLERRTPNTPPLDLRSPQGGKKKRRGGEGREGKVLVASPVKEKKRGRKKKEDGEGEALTSTT